MLLTTVVLLTAAMLLTMVTLANRNHTGMLQWHWLAAVRLFMMGAQAC